LAQLRVAPGERVELALELPAGSYRLRGPQLPWSADFRVCSAATVRDWDVNLKSAATPSIPDALRAGGQVLSLSNPHTSELLVRIERAAGTDDALTAARAASMALFRELFPGEILAPGQLASISMVTLVVTALDPSEADALYRDLGDAQAFSVIHDYLERLGEAICQGRGAVVKSLGEGVLASFSEVTAAVQTVLDLIPRITRPEAQWRLRPRIGVHRGTTLAATLNDQLDYFGTTARQAGRILDYARAGELVLTRAVAGDPEVAALLGERRIEAEVIRSDLPEHPHLIRVQIDRSLSLDG
jgi:class 3 adenylate cyclase